MKSSITAPVNGEQLPKLEQFRTTSETTPAELQGLERITPSDAATLAEVGLVTTGEQRSGTLIWQDFFPRYVQSMTAGMELLPLAEALEKYDWLQEKYLWKAVPADWDEVTARCAAQPRPEGYFLRVSKGTKVTLPCQTALYMASENIAQMIHNVVIVEDGAELRLIAGCVTQHGVVSGLHLSVDEQFIGKNAKLINTMAQGWGPEVMVYPRAGTIVAEGGRYENNYISLRPAKYISSNPQTRLNGKGASAKLLTVILGAAGSTLDIGGDIYLNADGTTAELTHRGVCAGGKMYQKGLLVGNAACKAHVDCAGMLLDAGADGFIESTPGIRARHPEAQVSHEASIGKIAPEQVEYLQSRGLEEREAISLLIRGFLGTEIAGLGAELDDQIAAIAQLAGHGEK
jgi:Fe-S cluster assembly scaffold protein SufB